MTKPFDMALFLSGVLTGSKVTQKRHLRQARVMQAAIQERWQRDNPWTWQLKHVRWFLTQHLKDHSDATRYYYLLTASLVWKRLGKDRDLVIASRRHSWALSDQLAQALGLLDRHKDEQKSACKIASIEMTHLFA